MVQHKRNYHPTTTLTREELKAEVARAKGMDEAILLIYQTTGKKWSPSEIYESLIKAGRKGAITSVRRSINTLTNAGYLIMLEEQRMGLYHSKEHYWSLTNKHPLPTAQQATIFP